MQLFSKITMALLFCSCLSSCQNGMNSRTPTDTKIKSLQDLTIETLRNQKFGAPITSVSPLDITCVDKAAIKSAPSENSDYSSYMGRYQSDGLDVYTRMSIPNTPAPESGYPVIVFAHGYVGAAAAPTYTLGCDPESMYSENTDAYARAGFVVLSPGYRGHATINDVPADGIEFMETWDNGTYLSTVFYAIDVLNLMGGLSNKLNANGLSQPVPLNLDAVHLAGHSQGGDVALTVLAATGESAKNGIQFKSASIWSGTFADKFAQIETFYPMQKTPEAFLSGDGTWTGSAVGKDGSVNSKFIFAYPPDWIETPVQSEWTWQKDTWNIPTIAGAIEEKLGEMYSTLNTKVANLSGLEYRILNDESAGVRVEHDPRIKYDYPSIGGFNKPQFINEPLILHFPDRDMYSLPMWNRDLCQRINKQGGDCTPYEYPENTHGMRLSEHEWFSSEKAVEGYATMVERDIAWFRGEDPNVIELRPKNGK